MRELLLKVFGIDGTDSIGRALAESLPDNSIVSLEGTLGVGKTRLVQCVARYLDVENDIVTSPTFVLLHEYEGSRLIYHFDLYRLSNENEFKQLDPDDYFERNGITFIEWGDKFPQILPNEKLQIQIEITGEESRLFHFNAIGNKYNKAIEMLSSLPSKDNHVVKLQ
ncbi:MAG: tRNA (adenosine(37)-N6)-threonylcarbamoyltransferase complex ATPase subunit type 1 TsaE [Planctomycetaceae bacterium]|jgi:tRNA threonylcarbamoyladenosine biosynthesis protein TsaE|nr:tRNA (adenosine(37)-N6)-threonylcarbamoyltransferase complex ATPase subunit type 1 TsaE [Planctomycetaceae bacterium]